MKRAPRTASPTPWGWAFAGALCGLAGALVFFAPARWLAAGVAQDSQGRLQLDDARGTVWTGSARLSLTGGAGSSDAAALPGRVQWQLRPAWQGAALQVQTDCCTQQPLSVGARLRWGGVDLDVADAVSQWPAAVTSGPVVILTFDLAHLVAWQRDYLAPVISIERRRQPTIAEIAAVLGRRTRIDALRTPADCEDGFLDAYWSRPEALLDPRVRATQSAWSLISRESEDEVVDRLRTDLASGAWDEDHGYLRHHRDHDGALRLIVSPR